MGHGAWSDKTADASPVLDLNSTTAPPCGHIRSQSLRSVLMMNHFRV